MSHSTAPSLTPLSAATPWLPPSAPEANATSLATESSTFAEKTKNDDDKNQREMDELMKKPPEERPLLLVPFVQAPQGKQATGLDLNGVFRHRRHYGTATGLATQTSALSLRKP